MPKLSSTCLLELEPRSDGQPALSALTSVSWEGGEHSCPRALVVVSGELDIATVGLLRAVTPEFLLVTDPRLDRRVEVVLDWVGVTFLDSSALHYLEDLSARGIREGWTVTLLPPAAATPARVLRFAAGRGWIPGHLAPAALLPPPSRSGARCEAATAGQRL